MTPRSARAAADEKQQRHARGRLRKELQRHRHAIRPADHRRALGALVVEDRERVGRVIGDRRRPPLARWIVGKQPAVVPSEAAVAVGQVRDLTSEAVPARAEAIDEQDGRPGAARVVDELAAIPGDAPLDLGGPHCGATVAPRPL